ncbi:hypothetical protein [Streptomyces neyagawaensis]|uniref:hypothetical protein n=1 Tax=Streptomyces neyagawaensis TaxID=42238 RepID=UPI00201D127C|nr:hypothetical protein [Streptomyces neyagawaensis]MCL6733524.1 hypothetical protein [Streptomyces neyagawaensis]MDE1685337.1 hypothetical protein [Streptomyces neyagawaensis]
MPQSESEWANAFPWSLSYRWGHSALAVDFDLSGDTARLVRVRRPGDPEEVEADVLLPLVDVVLHGEGSGRSRPPFTGSVLGERLRYRAHRSALEAEGGPGVRWHRLVVELRDPESGVAAFVEFASPDGVCVLRSRVRLRNEGDAPVTMRSLGSLLLGGLPSPEELTVFQGRDEWLTQCPCSGDGPFTMGALRCRTDGRTWLWQIESASSGVGEVGEAAGRTYLALGGPATGEHQGGEGLKPGAEFASGWVALALGTGFDGALAELTAYRHAVRRPRLGVGPGA